MRDLFPLLERTAVLPTVDCYLRTRTRQTASLHARSEITSSSGNVTKVTKVTKVTNVTKVTKVKRLHSR